MVKRCLNLFTNQLDCLSTVHLSYINLSNMYPDSILPYTSFTGRKGKSKRCQVPNYSPIWP